MLNRPVTNDLGLLRGPVEIEMAGRFRRRGRLGRGVEQLAFRQIAGPITERLAHAHRAGAAIFRGLAPRLLD